MTEGKGMQDAIGFIRESNRIAALSGAGISTEAGVPDFRGPQGLWNNAELMEKLSANGFRRDPECFYRANIPLMAAMAAAEPTGAHRLLARLEEMGKLQAVVTQNIDGLHRKAGSRTVFEVHGTYRTGHCPECGDTFEMDPFYREIESGRLKVPLCGRCRVPIKPDIVLFGELLPQDAWSGSVNAMERCDLLLVLGSSLVVYPAAELPSIAHACGARLVIVNLEETAYDRMALVVREKLGNFAEAALSALK
jgi:NAD-dependent deacetylase